jgi:proteasome lid subunit RPN8/RPN11
MWEMMLRVTREALQRMCAEATAAADEECCGLLLGVDRIAEARPARNVAADRQLRFEIDPQALIDAHRAARHGAQPVIGYYHSHPGGAAVPSATDRAMAEGDGRVWAIVGEDGVTFWRDDGQGLARLSYTVEDR